MKAAEIQEESMYRQKSITELEKISGRNKDPEMCRRIKDLLTRLRNQPEKQNHSTETLESKLKALQSHFTWDLEAGRPNLIHLRNILKNIGPEEENLWLGHIYNLQGFIQFKLGSTEEALKLFNQATETFQQQKTLMNVPG
ncbi:hypothetical protein CRENBAI_023368 [Crenichthys baileyi]|uniref:Uncharacterized protein n=1 Tax=Crenichthys baileyi TaxID=28760 RepID=A0AAV9S3E4_9TELE